MTTSSHGAHVVPFGWDKGLQGRALFLIAIAFSAFQIVVAAYHPFSSQVVRAIHVGFMLLLSFALLQHWLPRRPVAPLAWLVGLTAFGLAFYHWIFESDLIVRAGDPTPCSASTCRATSRTAATPTTSSSNTSPSAPKASTASRPTSAPLTSSSSSCSAPSLNRPA
jgi:hypothetical protein